MAGKPPFPPKPGKGKPAAKPGAKPVAPGKKPFPPKPGKKAC